MLRIAEALIDQLTIESYRIWTRSSRCARAPAKPAW